MSNSPLVCFTRLSPNNSGKRTHSIDTITIHCMAGNGSIEACGALFADSSRQASSNYGVGSDGRIGLYVDEDNRSWCTSSSENDNRAVTIEVANNSGAPDWTVSDQAYAATVDLVTDICKRNGIKKLVWATDKNTRINHLNGCNMTVHRDFASKSCPGDYLYARHGAIANEVNQRLEDNNMTGEEIYNRLMEYLRSLPTSDYAKESSKKGVASGYFSDGDGDGLVDDPHAWLKRQELATVLNRMGLLDK